MIKTANIVDLLEFDEEWVELIIEAKNMGMQPGEVRDFLANIIKEEILGIDELTKPRS